MKFGVKSDKGLVRERNEDCFNIITGNAGIPVSFIIADGMGGHNSGDIASKMAVDSVSEGILKSVENLADENRILETIQNIMADANAGIFSVARELESLLGMGTTLIIAVVFNKKLFIGHIGDSRVYLIRRGRMTQITTDHSFVEELVQSGSLTREEAQNHPKKHVITRALGCAEYVQVDTLVCDMDDDDIFILCTDGLTKMLHEDEIKQIIEDGITHEPEFICNELVRMANEKGGEDNITVMICKNG